ncbi:AI-2E family transporter [Inquilinus sp. CAU 1745]|uniref:AI-2E family transporter n=1 Tax=Inquilinus sp. CAU 1745 TaxID=3140369 RepID=UPI00325AE006
MTEARNLRFWLIGLVVLCLLLWLLSGMLMPFVIGMAIAYLLDPLADRLQRLGLPRWVATTLVLLLFAVIVILLLVLLVPILQNQIAQFIEALPSYRESLQNLLAPIIGQLRDQIAQQDFEEVRSAVGDYAGKALSWLGTALGGLWRGGLAVIDVVSILVITPVVAFYLLRDWDVMTDHIDELLPRRSAATIRSLAREVDRTLASFVRGQGTVCLVLGSFYAIALAFAGLDFGILVGLMSGILSFIPFVGTIVGFVASMGIALVQFDSWTMWAVIAGIFVFGQVVEGNFLTPKLVGDSVGLHPVWVMFALLAGGSLFGFTGVLLAVPVAAIIGVLIRFFIGRYRASAYYHDEAVILDSGGERAPASDNPSAIDGRP